MPKRRASLETLPDELTLTVAAATVAVGRSSVLPSLLRESAETTIQIEGQSAGPRHTKPRDTLLLVSAIKGTSKIFGCALGGKTPWMVDCELPRNQLADLVTMVCTRMLLAVDMTFDHLRWHKGTLLSIEFRTKPWPRE